MEKRAFRRIAVVLGSAAALGWSLPASAQTFLRDRSVAQGPGYQAGDWEIHPGLAAQIGYDSNYFERSDKTDPRYVNAAPTNPVEGTGLVQVTPSISFRSFATNGPRAINVREPPAVIFSGGASGTYSEFLSSDQLIRDQRNMSADADVLAMFMSGKPVGGSISGTWSRMIQPTVLGNPDLSYNNDTITGTADLRLQPGMGTLDWHFGYQFTGIFFEDSQSTVYNNLLHTVYTRGRWRFRPRTALVYEGSIGSHTFPKADGAIFALHTQTPIRTAIGIDGLVTSRVSLLAMVGYSGLFASRGNGNDPSVQQYDSVTGNAEIRFFPMRTIVEGMENQGTAVLATNIALGYQRVMQSSYLNDYVSTDRGYLRAVYNGEGRWLLTVEGGVGAYAHPDLYFSDGVAGTNTPVLMHTGYTDIRADGTLFAEYRVLPSVGINATVSYQENFSNVILPVTVNDVNNAATGRFYDQSWRRIQAFIGARWMM